MLEMDPAKLTSCCTVCCSFSLVLTHHMIVLRIPIFIDIEIEESAWN